MHKIVWTPLAIDSLNQIYHFTVETWNENIAEKLLIQLDYKISQLSLNPLLGPKFEDSSFRRILIHRNVSLFYKVNNDSVRLLLVWDNRQNPQSLTKTLKL